MSLHLWPRLCKNVFENNRRSRKEQISRFLANSNREKRRNICRFHLATWTAKLSERFYTASAGSCPKDARQEGRHQGRSTAPPSPEHHQPQYPSPGAAGAPKRPNSPSINPSSANPAQFGAHSKCLTDQLDYLYSSWYCFLTHGYLDDFLQG